MNIAGIFNGTLTPPGFFLTISGTGSLNLVAGADAFATGGADGGTTTIAVPMTGPGQVALEGSAQIFFDATNTYTGGTFFGYPGVTAFTSTVNFNNGRAFGTGPLEMTASGAGSTMTVQGTLPVTITNSFIATHVTFNINGNAAGLTFSGPWSLPATPNLALGGSANLVIISGVMSGVGGFNKYNPATLMLTASNTFTGGVTVSNGTLALGAGGSISHAASLTLSPGANATVFDVSAISNFVLGGSTTLLARGTSPSAVFAANIRGAVGGSVDLGSRPIILSFTPTALNDNTAHPALYVSQGSLILGNNSITVTNSATFALGAGTYRIIQVGDGTTGIISGAPNSAVSVFGKGLVAGATAYLVVSNGDVNMIVKPMAVFSALSTNQSNIFGLGAASVTLAGKVSAGSLYPATNESVGIGINGNTNAAPIKDTTGDFAFTFDPASIPYSATNYLLGYVYAGNNILSAAASNTTLLDNGFFIDDQLPGFFSGLNVFFTNTAGISNYTWSTTNPGLPVTDWTLEGAMQEQPLHDGSGNSRYSINVTPATSLVYYISGPSLNWPHLAPAGVQWITTDAGGNYGYFTTNVDISPAGVLAFPLPPTIVVQPSASQTVLLGKNANFDVTVTGTRPMSYQWFFNTNTPVTGVVTNSPLTITNVSTNQVGNYMVYVTNIYGSVTSAVATLSVLPPPQMTSQLTPGGFQFSGIAPPGNTYWVQSTTNISPPAVWNTVLTNTVGTNGLAQFTDTNVATNPGLFYRLVFP